MGAFDDLIPAQRTEGQTQTNPFEDLVPKPNTVAQVNPFEDLVPTKTPAPVNPNPSHVVTGYEPSLIDKLGAASDSVFAPVASALTSLFGVRNFNSAKPPAQTASAIASTPIVDTGSATLDGKELPVSFAQTQGWQTPSDTEANRQATMQTIIDDRPQIGLPVAKPLLTQGYDTVREGLSPFLGPTDAQRERDSVTVGNDADGNAIRAYKPGGSTLDQIGLIPALGPGNPNAHNLPHFGVQTNAVDQFFAGVDNNAIDLANFAKSPLGLVTAGIGALPAEASVIAPAVQALQRGTSLGFSADMAHGLPEQYQQFADSKGVQESTEKGLGLALAALFTGATAKHGLTGHVASVDPAIPPATSEVSPGDIDALHSAIDNPNKLVTPINIGVPSPETLGVPQLTPEEFSAAKEPVATPTTAPIPEGEHPTVAGGVAVEAPASVSVETPEKTESFTPSRDWQEVPAGVVVPSGGEYRIDMEAGKAYARWPDLKEPDVAPDLQDSGDAVSREVPAAEAQTIALIESAPAESIPERPVDEALTDSEASTVPSASKAAVEAPAKRVTSNKNSIVDEERAKRGESPIEAPLRQSNPETWDAAAREMEVNPTRGDELVAELKHEPRAIKGVEEAVLLRHKIQLDNQAALAAEAVNNPKTSEADRITAKIRLQGLNDRINDADVSRRLAGAEWGRSGQFRQRLADEDFSLQKMLRDRQASKDGKPLTDREFKEVSDLHDMLKAKQAELVAHEQAAQTEQLRQVFEHFIQEAKKTMPKTGQKGAARITSFLDSQAEAARARIKARGGRFNSGIDPTQLADHVIIGASHIANGIVKFGDWSTKMLREFGAVIKPHLQEIFDKSNSFRDETEKQLKGKADATVEEALTKVIGNGESIESLDHNSLAELAKAHIRNGVSTVEDLISKLHTDLAPHFEGLTEKDVRDTLSGYGETKLMNQEAVAAKLRDLTAQSRTLSQLEDAENGEAPKRTGLQRDQPSDRLRALQAKVQEAMRRMGITVEDPEQQLKTALDGIKTRLKNQIKDLATEMETGEKRAKSDGIPYDAEAEKLRASRDRIQKTLEDIEGKPEMTDEQRVRIASDSLDKHIAELERQIKEGDLNPDKQGTKTPETPELVAKRAFLDSLQAEKQRLIDTDTDLQEKKTHDKLQASSFELERKIQENDLEITKRGKSIFTADTQATTALKVENTALRKQLKAKRDALKPRRSPEEIALQAYKTRLQKSLGDYQQKLAIKDYTTKTRTAQKLDEEAQKLNVQVEGMKLQIRRRNEAARLANRTLIEKTIDAVPKVVRFNMLTSLKVIPKLASYMVEGAVAAPLEHAAAHVVGKLMPAVADRAPTWGRFSPKAEGAAIKATVSNVASNMIKAFGHKSDIDVLHGKPDISPKGFGDTPGGLHAALKEPLKQNEFARSTTMWDEWNKKNGANIEDADVKQKTNAESYKNAQSVILQDDNKLNAMWSSAKRMALTPDKETGKPTLGGRAAAAVMDTAVPISKVPTNIVARYLEYTFGVLPGSVKLVRAYSKGFENLKPEQADVIMRLMTRGMVGPALLAWGMFHPANFGGFYQSGEKRQDGDVKPGDIRVGSVDIPSYLLHNPVTVIPQIGATITRVALKVHKGEPVGLMGGIGHAGISMLEEVPFVREMFNLTGFFKNPSMNSLAAGAVKRAIPAALPQIAGWTDTDSRGGSVQRKPQSISDYLKMGVPGLRQEVPEKRNGRLY